MLPNHFKMYELKGKSLDAAQNLHIKMRHELLPAFVALQNAHKGGALDMIKATMLATPILLGQKTVSITAAAKAFKNGDFALLVDAFKAKHKDLYDATGQNNTFVQVTQVDGAYPRAYAHTPQIYFHPEGIDKRMLMLAPVDYKGNSFAPVDGILFTDEQAEIVAKGMWSNGWSDPTPVIHRVDPRGVGTPVDFDSATSLCKKQPAPFDSAKAQRLLWIFNNFMTHMVATKDLKGMSEHDTSFKYELKAGVNGAPVLLVEAFNNKTGAAIPVPDNACFRVRPNGNAYEVLPRASIPQHKADTAGGLALQGFIDQLPPLKREDLWQKANEDDIQCFIQPPPLPLALLHMDQRAPWPFPKSSP